MAARCKTFLRFYMFDGNLHLLHSERREPQNQMSSDYAQPTSKGQGISGGGPGEKAGDVRGPDKGTSELEEKDMQGAAGEGRTADAVKGKSGASSIGGNKHSAGA